MDIEFKYPFEGGKIDIRLNPESRPRFALSVWYPTEEGSVSSSTEFEIEPGRDGKLFITRVCSGESVDCDGRGSHQYGYCVPVVTVQEDDEETYTVRTLPDGNIDWSMMDGARRDYTAEAEGY